MNDVEDDAADTAVDTAREMDEIVQRIFAAMTMRVCAPVRHGCHEDGELQARIVFLESCCKSCEISLRVEDADALVRLLTGSPDETLRTDVAGELCNMIAGGWKARRSAASEQMKMLAPETLAGIKTATEECPRCFRGTYAFAEGRFHVRLRCESAHVADCRKTGEQQRRYAGESNGRDGAGGGEGSAGCADHGAPRHEQAQAEAFQRG